MADKPRVVIVGSGSDLERVRQLLAGMATEGLEIILSDKERVDIALQEVVAPPKFKAPELLELETSREYRRRQKYGRHDSWKRGR